MVSLIYSNMLTPTFSSQLILLPALSDVTGLPVSQMPWEEGAERLTWTNMKLHS